MYYLCNSLDMMFILHLLCEVICFLRPFPVEKQGLSKQVLLYHFILVLLFNLYKFMVSDLKYLTSVFHQLADVFI